MISFVSMFMDSLFSFIKSAPMMTSFSRFWITRNDHRKVRLLMQTGTEMIPCTFKALPCTSEIRNVEGSTLIPNCCNRSAVPVDIAECVAPESNSVFACVDKICMKAIGLGSC